MSFETSPLQMRMHRAAMLIRQQLVRPPNAIRDAGISLTRAHGVRGYESENSACATAQEPNQKSRDWLLMSLLKERENRAPPGFYRTIIFAVCGEFGGTITDVVSKRRQQYIILPRHAAMYLCKTITCMSFPEIGRRFGTRDHTTVLAAVHKMSKRMLVDSFICQTVVELQLDLERQLLRWRNGVD